MSDNNGNMTALQHLDGDSRQALDSAWHRDSAAASLERWRDLCKQQQWDRVPSNLPLLIQVFGASWYFTRFVFFRGPAITDLIDDDPLPALENGNMAARIQSIDVEQSPDSALDALRVVKNEIMLQVLLAELRQSIAQPELEAKLTQLADLTLAMALRIYSHHSAPLLEDHLGVLAMGRMAGGEMNFGSDLDLVFLYPGEQPDWFERAARLVRALLRGIAQAAPAGSLYDIDMRLRPHGSAGVLITSNASFTDYHSEQRDIWQRQLMTRCRPVIDGGGMASDVLESVRPSIYADYDRELLRGEITGMRARVEHELGSPAGRYELKRGRGGIMDIDFVSHYLQLAHGHEDKGLQTPSTRAALQALHQRRLLSGDDHDTLLGGYDFLKRMEGRLRVFDMKPVSSISRQPEELTALARSMGYDGDEPAIGEQLLADYHATCNAVRAVFDRVMENSGSG